MTHPLLAEGGISPNFFYCNDRAYNKGIENWSRNIFITFITFITFAPATYTIGVVISNLFITSGHIFCIINFLLIIDIPYK